MNFFNALQWNPNMSSQRLIVDGLKFAEAPRWHQGRLWFSDVHDFKLKAVTPEGVLSIIAAFPSRPSGLGILPDGRLLMATALDGKLWTVTTDGAVTEAADLSHLITGLLNDMVVDGFGRAFVGDTGFKMGPGVAPRPGRVVFWKEGQSPRVVAEDVTFPNGCIVTPDGTRYLVAETLANRISSFALSSDGSLSDRQVFAELDSSPDGMCLDTENGIWVGLPLKGEFIYIGADGRIVKRMRAMAPFAVTCALGGPQRRTLFLCSAETDLQRLGRGESSARIDACSVAVGGAGWP
jgi:sugar lactone lactonase YvrE